MAQFRRSPRDLEEVDYARQMSSSGGRPRREKGTEAELSALGIIREAKNPVEQKMMPRSSMGYSTPSGQNACHILADSSIRAIVSEIVKRDAALTESQEAALTNFGEIFDVQDVSSKIANSRMTHKVRDKAASVGSVYKGLGHSVFNLRSGDEDANQRQVLSSFDPILKPQYWGDPPTIDDIKQNPEEYYNDKTRAIYDATRRLGDVGLVGQKVIDAALLPAWSKETKQIRTSGVFIGPMNKDETYFPTRKKVSKQLSTKRLKGAFRAMPTDIDKDVVGQTRSKRSLSTTNVVQNKRIRFTRSGGNIDDE